MPREKIPESSYAKVEVVEELLPEEEADRQRLELKVERAFYEAGSGLRELRDRRLYRDRYQTFEEYCQKRFGYTRISAYHKIAAAEVFENLLTNTYQHDPHEGQQILLTKSYQILPTKETQVRPLSKLEPTEQQEVWQQAVEAANGKVPTERLVKSIVEQLKEKPTPQLSIAYKRGDVFTLQGMTGAERRYNCCWAIACEVHEFPLKVETHDAMLLVKPNNIAPVEERQVCNQLLELLKRIKQLRKCDLDRGAEVVLESLGKRTFLTEVEEKLLQVLENHYDIV